MPYQHNNKKTQNFRYFPFQPASTASEFKFGTQMQQLFHKEKELNENSPTGRKKKYNRQHAIHAEQPDTNTKGGKKVFLFYYCTYISNLSMASEVKVKKSPSVFDFSGRNRVQFFTRLMSIRGRVMMREKKKINGVVTGRRTSHLFNQTKRKENKALFKRKRQIYKRKGVANLIKSSQVLSFII